VLVPSHAQSSNFWSHDVSEPSHFKSNHVQSQLFSFFCKSRQRLRCIRQTPARSNERCSPRKKRALGPKFVPCDRNRICILYRLACWCKYLRRCTSLTRRLRWRFLRPGTADSSPSTPRRTFPSYSSTSFRRTRDCKTHFPRFETLACTASRRAAKAIPRPGNERLLRSRSRYPRVG